MRLLSDSGEYFYRSYYGKQRQDGITPIFTIIGTKYKAINSTPLSAIDTFTSETGKVVELERKIILEQVLAGKMKPVESSLITVTNPEKIKVKKDDTNSKPKAPRKQSPYKGRR